MEWRGILPPIGAVVLLAACASPTPDRELGSDLSETATPTSMWENVPEGWSSLPPPPLDARPGARIWTDEQFFVWSGYTYAGGTAPNEGAIFNPESETWKVISPSPISGRYAPAAVWSGDEILIWGGISDEQGLGDGAAYNPSEDSWRLLPESPLSARAPIGAVWTGTEMIVWGSRERPDPPSDGAAYNPTTNEWRKLPDAPVAINLGNAVWTGEEMLVFGSSLDFNNVAALGRNEGAAYRPDTATWRSLPATELSPQATSLAWTGTRAIAWDYELKAAAYDPLAGNWESIPELPLQFSECYPSSAASDRSVFAWFCGQAALFDDTTGTWTEVNPPDRHLRELRDVVAPVAAGSLFLQTGIRSEEGAVLWAYKPPASK